MRGWTAHEVVKGSFARWRGALPQVSTACRARYSRPADKEGSTKPQVKGPFPRPPSSVGRALSADSPSATLGLTGRAVAVRVLQDIFRYVLRRSQSQVVAEQFVTRVRERSRRIGLVPHGGTPRDDLAPGLRTVAFERRAVVAYRVEGDKVVISNIFFGGRDYEAIYRGREPEPDHYSSAASHPPPPAPPHPTALPFDRPSEGQQGAGRRPVTANLRIRLAMPAVETTAVRVGGVTLRLT
jgi:toxin ParE1/3/4